MIVWKRKVSTFHSKSHPIQFLNPEPITLKVHIMWRNAKASLSQYCPKKKVFGDYMAKSMLMKRLRYHKLGFNEFFKKADELNDPLLSNDFTNNSDDSGSDCSSECSETHTTDTEY